MSKLLEAVKKASYHKPGSNTRGLDLDVVENLIRHHEAFRERMSTVGDGAELKQKLFHIVHENWWTLEGDARAGAEELLETIRPYLRTPSPLPTGDAIHLGFRAYSNALRDGLPHDQCVEAAMKAAIAAMSPLPIRGEVDAPSAINLGRKTT